MGATYTASTWSEVEDLLRENAGAGSYRLPALTALHDEELHEIVLDPAHRMVWWAWDNTPLGESGWTVECLDPQEAARMASDQIELVQDRQKDPASYAEGTGDPDVDQDALDEYAEILRLGLPVAPREATGQIKRHRELVQRQDELWQRTYAALVREASGTELGGATPHGGATRAAAALGITSVQVARLIAADDERRRRLAADITQASKT